MSTALGMNPSSFMRLKPRPSLFHNPSFVRIPHHTQPFISLKASPKCMDNMVRRHSLCPVESKVGRRRHSDVELKDYILRAKWVDDEYDTEERECANCAHDTLNHTLRVTRKPFEEFEVSEELVCGLYLDLNVTYASKIQAVSLPLILKAPYEHLIAQAHNGSGKTICFMLGMLNRADPKLSAPQAICVCPTQVLAIQNNEVLKIICKYTQIKSECAVPMDMTNCVPMSKRAPITAQILIGTPGTILKWVTSNKSNLSLVKCLVFDEADYMLAEIGFRNDSVRIMKLIAEFSTDCQVLLFSATFDEVAKDFASKIVKEYFRGVCNEVFLKEELFSYHIQQFKVKVPNENAKCSVIRNLLELGDGVRQTLIFVGTLNSAYALCEALDEYGVTVPIIHGDLGRENSDKIVKEFKEGRTRVLISTDLLARGFDQSKVNLVVNFDLPVKHETPMEPDCEVYSHRAGRLRRKGAVFNLLCDQKDEMVMAKIEQHFSEHYSMQVTEVDSRRDLRRALWLAKLA